MGNPSVFMQNAIVFRPGIQLTFRQLAEGNSEIRISKPETNPNIKLSEKECNIYRQLESDGRMC